MIHAIRKRVPTAGAAVPVPPRYPSGYEAALAGEAAACLPR
jgi:hypothetical protein